MFWVISCLSRPSKNPSPEHHTISPGLLLIIDELLVPRWPPAKAHRTLEVFVQTAHKNFKFRLSFHVRIHATASTSCCPLQATRRDFHVVGLRLSLSGQRATRLSARAASTAALVLDFHTTQVSGVYILQLAPCFVNL